MWCKNAVVGQLAQLPSTRSFKIIASKLRHILLSKNS